MHSTDLTTWSSSAGSRSTFGRAKAFSVTAEADRRSLKRLDIRQEGTRLVISRKKRLGDWSLLSRRFRAKVDVTLPVLTRLDASSGADVEVEGGFTGAMTVLASSGADVDMRGAEPESLGIVASSGSSVDAEGVEVGRVDIDASSGSDVDIAGTCGSLAAEASSGSDIDAENLDCKSGDLSASSGGRLNAQTSARVAADARTGGRIEVAGSPDEVVEDASLGRSRQGEIAPLGQQEAFEPRRSGSIVLLCQSDIVLICIFLHQNSRSRSAPC